MLSQCSLNGRLLYSKSSWTVSAQTFLTILEVMSKGVRQFTFWQILSISSGVAILRNLAYHYAPKMILSAIFSTPKSSKIYTVRYKMHTYSTPVYLEMLFLKKFLAQAFLKDVKAWVVLYIMGIIYLPH